MGEFEFQKNIEGIGACQDQTPESVGTCFMFWQSKDETLHCGLRAAGRRAEFSPGRKG